MAASVAFGSDGLQRLAASSSGTEGRFAYTLGASRLQTDGYRQHGQAERRLANARLNWKLGTDTQLTLVANSVELPEAQDPLGLTRAQWAADSRGVDPVAASFDTRKTMQQTQGGLVLEHGIDAANTLRLMVYRGHRNTVQFQAIPAATQANPLHLGGVIDLSSGLWQFAPALQAQLAAMWLDASYRNGFLTCTATPCAVANQVVAPGNRIPGIARASLFGALAWQPAGGWRLGLEARALGTVWVNDLNDDATPGYAMLAAHAGYQLSVGAWGLGALLRVDNLAGRRYAGSVIFNDGNGRFFEPAPGRTWLAETNASYRF